VDLAEVFVNTLRAALLGAVPAVQPPPFAFVDSSPSNGVLSREPYVKAWGRGLHSSTFRLTVTDFCGTGGACRGCFGGV